MLPRFEVGDIIELIPENFMDDWYEGKGMIVSTEDNIYTVHMFNLVKTSRKRLTRMELGEHRLEFIITEADEHGYFKRIA